MALATLARAAWFAPGEPIPRALLRASAGVDGADETAVLRFEDGLARLRELGLIASRRTVPWCCTGCWRRSCAARPAMPTRIARQVEAAVLAEAQRLNEAGYPAPLLAWQPQLRFRGRAARAERDSEHAGAASLERARLSPANGGRLRGRQGGLRAGAQDRRGSFGPDHPDVAIDVNNLGLCCRTWAIWRAPGRPSSGRSGSTRRASAPTTPRSPSASTTWAWC